MEFLAHLLCLFATLRGVSLAVNTRTIDNAWQFSVQIGYFQKASEIINQEGVYYLVEGTENLLYDCVAGTMTEWSVSDKAAIYKITYIKSSRKTEVTVSANVAPDVRGQETVISMTIDGYGRGWKNHVLYEENKCYILYNPDTEQFELWVSQNEVNYLPRCCEFAYWLATYKRNTHILYNKDRCKLVV
uniref:Putative secreted protein n=2 Tax=Ixodes ricinus TaxID=34613 RepID=A0A090XEQ4_IXORI